MNDAFNDLGMGDITPPKSETGIQKAMELQAKIAQGVNEGKIERSAAILLYAALKEGRLNEDLTIKK